MSSHQAISKSLALVEELRNVVRDAAAREEKLEQELGSRGGAIRAQLTTSTQEIQRELAAEVAVAAETLKQRNETLRQRFKTRESLLTEAHKQSRKRGTQQIEDYEGNQKYALQMEAMQRKRGREAGLQAADQQLRNLEDRTLSTGAVLDEALASAKGVFRGYGVYRSRMNQSEALESGLTASSSLEEVERLAAKAKDGVSRLRVQPAVKFFNLWPLWTVLILALPAAVPQLRASGIAAATYPLAAGISVALLLLALGLRALTRKSADPVALPLAATLARAQALQSAAPDLARGEHQAERQRIETNFAEFNQWMEAQWNQAASDGLARKEALPEILEQKLARARVTNERLLQARLQEAQQTYDRAAAQLTEVSNQRIRSQTETTDTKEGRLNVERQAQWDALESDWNQRIRPIYAAIEEVRRDAEGLFPAWESPFYKSWKPPGSFAQAAQLGRLEIQVATLAGRLPKSPRLALPGPAEFSLPLMLTYPQQGSVLYETQITGRETSVASLNNLIQRLLSVAPPGRLSFTVFDPVGLGQNFASVMHLADHEEQLINNRIWTQSDQIEQKLGELNEHMEKVIQMYLRNEYATIAEYNEQAGNIAEKYHFLVIADFPNQFTDTALRRLLSIATSGARCGVYTLIHWDRRHPLPAEFAIDELKKSSVCVHSKGEDFYVSNVILPGARLRLETPPAAEAAIEFIHRVGRANKDSNRVEVPFSHITPPDAELWSSETTSELRVPIGRTGATKLQYLSVGKGTRQHALLAGKTGSGKSTLFHVIITNLALWCSPEQVEFYLVDFKKGVEFKCYAAHRLPHAKVVAIESDREFGLSVLQKLDDELKRRGDLFRKLGVQDIPGYKRAGGTEPMPRSLLMIDEFQEFFTEDDKISQNASVLLDRIVRQGRAFGIHVILGSQTLGGAYTVARTTLGQMVIRIALQCNEADAYLIMDDNNPAPRLLSRPGEGIYNDAAGVVEANSPFQVVWLPDEVRDQYLAKVHARAEAGSTRYPGPFVFEGDAPADIRENALLRAALESTTPASTSPRVWLGAPNSIKGPTEVVFHRQSGNHLLLVGQREEASLSILACALIALSAQHAPGKARFVFLDGTAPESTERRFVDQVVGAIPHPVALGRSGDFDAIIQELDEELKVRTEDAAEAASRPAVFFLVHGLQKYKKLRNEEEFSFSTDDSSGPSAGAVFNKLICDGSSVGLHVLVACDTYNNVNRCLSRKAVTEFEMRVLFQMSANDSASLIDSPKASTLGLHRALYYNEQQGYLELFRPYSMPATEWLTEVKNSLARRSS